MAIFPVCRIRFLSWLHCFPLSPSLSRSVVLKSKRLQVCYSKEIGWNRGLKAKDISWLCCGSLWTPAVWAVGTSVLAFLCKVCWNPLKFENISFRTWNRLSGQGHQESAIEFYGCWPAMPMGISSLSLILVYLFFCLLEKTFPVQSWLY